MKPREEFMGKISKIKTALETIVETFTVKGELSPIVEQSVGDIIDKLDCGVEDVLQNACFFCPMRAICSLVKLRKTGGN